MVVISCPWILIISAISLYFLIQLRKINLKCTRDTYALKAGLMSPINSLIQDTLNGLTTIKAFKRERYFLKQLFDVSDT